MRGNLTIDKASMNLSYFLYTILLINNHDKLITRKEFVKEMASFIGVSPIKDGKENRTPYNKSKLPRYFGFVDVLEKDGESYLVLTNRGIKIVDFIGEKDGEPDKKYFIKSENRKDFIDLIFQSVVFESFGKNNSGAEQSNTDVEPPKVVFKTIKELGKATAEEICYVMYGLNNGTFNSFDEALEKVKKNRLNAFWDYSEIMEDWKITNIVNDCKIINIFTDSNIQLIKSHHDDRLGKNFYSLNDDLDSNYLSQIDNMQAIYTPLRMFAYYKGSNTSISNWVNDSILGGVSDTSYVFRDNERSFLGTLQGDEYIPGLIDDVLVKAFKYPKKNVYLIIDNVEESEFESKFDRYAPLLKQVIDLSSDFNGWSENIVFDKEAYNYINSQTTNIKKYLNKSEIRFPSNLQIVGTVLMSEKDKDVKFDFHFSRSLVESEIDDNKPLNENYYKFKKLLGWFVKQLNINNGITDGVKTSGQGYKEGSSIRKFYNDWRSYGEFTLDCNLISGYQSTFSKVNYINKTDTGINIRPKFDKNTKEIKYFYIDVYENDKHFNEDIALIFEKEYPLEELRLMDELEPNETLKELFDDFCKVIDTFSTRKQENNDFENCERLVGGENIILYGVPGAGKSWTIESYYRDENTKMQRVVFHPDYTYSDFVGQILPQSKDGNVSYDFIPGPFTKIVNDAYRNPNQKFILVIEEINRGNAPAIFGDIFQLLDRNKNGRSSYEISNADVAKIVYRDENHPVYLPSNLSIICTMNTSDQNVFTLDTAFQRRWNMRLIENTFKKDTPEEKTFAEHPILDSDIKWEAFCETINAQILEKNQNLTSSEDKRLGTHFVTIDDLIFDINENNDNITQAERSKAILKNRRFPEKVIKYLWDDAFKFYRDEIFKGEFNSLEKVINEFTSKSKNDRFNIFKDNIKAAIEEANKS